MQRAHQSSASLHIGLQNMMIVGTVGSYVLGIAWLGRVNNKAR